MFPLLIAILSCSFLSFGEGLRVGGMGVTAIQRCPYGNYFTDGCVTCSCDPVSGQQVCENMIACPRKKIKCPMGRKYEDECGNDCTCFENTGAIFCKEKGPCNTIKRRNIWQPPLPLRPPPLSSSTQQPPIFIANENIKNNAPPDFESFEIPSSVPIPKEDLLIEPALIIRKKSSVKKDKKHPTTLLYLYEKQLKSMKDFKNYYKHYVNNKDEGQVKEKTEGNLLGQGSNHIPLELHVPVASKPLKESNWIFKNMHNPTLLGQNVKKQKQMSTSDMSKYFVNPSTTKRPQQQSYDLYAYTYENSKNGTFSGLEKAVEEYPKITQRPAIRLESSSAKVAIYDVDVVGGKSQINATPRPSHIAMSSSTLRPSLMYKTKGPEYFEHAVSSSTTQRPAVHFYTATSSRPKWSSTSATDPFAPKNVSLMKQNKGIQLVQRPSLVREEQLVQSPSNAQYVHAELNKPIFLNHIVATRNYPEIYLNPQNKQMTSYNDYDEYQHGPPPLRLPPHPPPPFDRPKQYRLFIKNAANRPHFHSDSNNRVPLFVDKIAHEFFRKPSIFVPKIKHGPGGRQELELNRVVYDHKNMIPKELVLEPGGPPLKVKFSPQAERDMNREWMEAMSKLNKEKGALGYQQQQHSQYSHNTPFVVSTPRPKIHHYHHHYQSYPSNQQNNQGPTGYTYRKDPNYHKFKTFDQSQIQDGFGYQHSEGGYIQEILPRPGPIPSPPSRYDDGPRKQHPPEKTVTVFNSPSYDDEEQRQADPYFHNTASHSYKDVIIMDHPQPTENGVIDSSTINYDYDPYAAPTPPTATEMGSDYVPVSPRPSPSYFEEATPTEGLSYQDYPSFSADMMPQATEIEDDDNDQGTLLIQSIKKGEEITQRPPTQRERIRIQDILQRKKGTIKNVRIKEEKITTTTTPTPTTTATTAAYPPSEVFDPEKILRELLALDPDIGPDAILMKDDGQTIPPLRTTTTSAPSTTTTEATPPPTTTSNEQPLINIKGDSGIVPQEYEPYHDFSETGKYETFLLMTTPTPKMNIPEETSSVSSFEQFYQDLFRPQKKREENVKRIGPDAVLETEGVAKIFKYDKIIKSFKSGDEEQSEEAASRNLDKRNNNKNETITTTPTPISKKRGKAANKEKSVNNKNSKSSSTIKPKRNKKTTTIEPTSTTPNPAEASFKKELDWKSNLMADICSVSPNSALCFTYKSLCMLMAK